MRLVKKTAALLLLALMTALAATACSGGDSLTVTFRAGDQTVTQQAIAGSTVLAPALEREGFTLNGWYTDEGLTDRFEFGTAVQEDLTLYAEWVRSSYAVTFEGAEGIAVQRVAPGGLAVEPAVETAPGVALEGWYTDADKTQPFDFGTPVNSDLTLYAKFAARTFSVTYDLAFVGGSAPVQDEVAFDGSFAVAEAPVRTGYTFEGWTDGQRVYAPGETYTVSGENDVVLVACWETAVFEVRFYNDAGQAVGAAVVPYGGAAIPPSDDRAASSRWAYRLTGWDKALNYITENTEVHGVYAYTPTENEHFNFVLREDGQSYAISLKTTDLSEIALPAELDGLPVTEILPQGFAGCEADRVYIPSSYRSMGWEAFYRSAVREVTIEEGLTYIDHCAFQNSNIQTLNLPASLESIGYFVFNRAYNFNAPTLDEGSPHLIWEDGLLLSADRTKLMFVSPQTQHLVIPASVTDVWAGLCSDYNLLQSVTIEGDVRELSAGTFYNCSSLTSLTINGSVARIGGEGDLPEGYDSECEIPDSGAFFYCDLSVVRLPGIRYLGSAAFNWNYNLRELYLDSTIEFLGDAFVDNSNLSLTTVEMMGATENDHYVIEDGTVIEKGTGLNGGDTFMMFLAANETAEYTIPQGVTSVRPFAFQGTVHLVTVTVPEGVEEIMTGTFMASNYWYDEETGESGIQTSLTTVHLPSSLKRITSTIDIWGGVEQWGSVRGAFLDCEKLTTVTFGENSRLEFVGDNAFAGTAVTSFHIPATLTEIGIAALGSTGLVTLTCDEDNPVYTVVDNVLYDKEMTTLIRYPSADPRTSFSIPEGVTAVGDYAAVNLQYLESVTFPATLRTIGISAFYGSQALRSLVFNEGLESIGETAFNSSAALESIVFPASLATVGADAFTLLPALTAVEFRGETPPDIWLMSYPPFIAEVIFDMETGMETIVVNEELIFTVPGASFAEYYTLFLGYGNGLADHIDALGLERTTFSFVSNGGTPVESVTGYALTSMPMPTREDGLYFQGWYTQDGSENGDWGERVSDFPYFRLGEADVTLYARWENTRYQDGLTFDFGFELGTDPASFTLSCDRTWYFVFRAPVNGRAYLRWDLEGLFLGYSAFSIPEANMDFWIMRQSDELGSYWTFEAGKTYYIQMLNFSIDYNYDLEEITSNFWIEMVQDSSVIPTPDQASLAPASALVPEAKTSGKQD